MRRTERELVPYVRGEAVLEERARPSLVAEREQNERELERGPEVRGVGVERRPQELRVSLEASCPLGRGLMVPDRRVGQSTPSNRCGAGKTGSGSADEPPRKVGSDDARRPRLLIDEVDVVPVHPERRQGGSGDRLVGVEKQQIVGRAVRELQGFGPVRPEVPPRAPMERAGHPAKHPLDEIRGAVPGSRVHDRPRVDERERRRQAGLDRRGGVPNDHRQPDRLTIASLLPGAHTEAAQWQLAAGTVLSG